MINDTFLLGSIWLLELTAQVHRGTNETGELTKVLACLRSSQLGFGRFGNEHNKYEKEYCQASLIMDAVINIGLEFIGPEFL